MANGKDVYYFSHDSNARNDEKVLMLRVKHGWEGYGIYWALIEMMFESTDTRLPHEKIEGIALGNNIEIALLKQIIDTAIEEGLFKSDGKYFWSESLRRRKKKFHELRERRSAAGVKGAEKRWGEGKSMAKPKQSHSTAIAKNSKGKESKGNKIKGNEIKEDIPDKKSYGEDGAVKLTEHEYNKLGERLGNKRGDYIDRLNNYIHQSPEKAEKYVSHYHTILNWARGDGVIKSLEEEKRIKDAGGDHIEREKKKWQKKGREKLQRMVGEY